MKRTLFLLALITGLSVNLVYMVKDAQQDYFPTKMLDANPSVTENVDLPPDTVSVKEAQPNSLSTVTPISNDVTTETSVVIPPAIPTSITPETSPIDVTTSDRPLAIPNDVVWLSATGSKYHSINNCGKMDATKAQQIPIQNAIDNKIMQCDNCY